MLASIQLPMMEHQSPPHTPPRLRNAEYKSKKEYDTPTRARVLALLDAGRTHEEVYRSEHVSRRTQQNWSKRGIHRTGAKRTGRARVIDAASLRRLLRAVKTDWAGRRLIWHKLAAQTSARTSDGSVSGATVKRSLADAGFYVCRACQKSWLRPGNVAARLSHCRDYIKKPVSFWQQVAFSNAMRLDICTKGAEHLVQDLDEIFHLDCQQFRKCGKESRLHAWSAVGFGWKAPLIFYDPTEKVSEAVQEELSKILAGQDESGLDIVHQTAEGEQNLLGERDSICKHMCRDKAACSHACCKSSQKNAGGNLTEMQYTAWVLHGQVQALARQHSSRQGDLYLLEESSGDQPPHNACSVDDMSTEYKRWLHQDTRGRFHSFYNPPQSPDFNVMENCWHYMKQKLRTRSFTSLEEIKTACIAIWDTELPQSWVNEQIETMPARLQESIKREGLQSSYWKDGKKDAKEPGDHQTAV